MIELSFKILSSLAENETCRAEIIQNKGLLVAVHMYKQEKAMNIKKQVIRLLGNLALDHLELH